MLRAVWFFIAVLTVAFSTIASALAEMPKPYCPAANDSAQFSDRNTRVRGVFSGDDGWLSSPAELREDYETPNLASMELIVDALAAKGTKLVVTVMPMRPLVYPEKMPEGALSSEELELHRNQYRQTILSLRSVGILAPDNLEAFLAAKDSGDVYFARDHHWTPFGAQVVAQAIGQLLKEDVNFPASNLSFVDTDKGSMENTGSFLSAVQSLCNDKILQPETMQRVETEKSQEGVGLFTEEAPPQLVIAGTSFSRKWIGDMFNFGGSLEHATGEEVLNVAINGGGSWSSILAYLSSDEFQANPPAYLIWETSNVFGKPDISLTAQILGSIKGKCASNTIFDTKAPADMPLQVALSGVPNIAGPSYRIEVEFTDPEASRVDLSFAGNIKNEKIQLSLPSEATGDRRFFAELPRDIGGIQEVLVSPKEGQKGEFRVAVCASAETTAAEPPAASPPITPAAEQPGALRAALDTGLLSVTLFGEAYDGNPILAVEVNGQIVANEEINSLARDKPQTVSVPVPLGVSQVRMRLANDLHKGRRMDRNLQITSISFGGRLLPMSSFQPANSAAIVSNGDFRIKSGSWVVLDLPPASTSADQEKTCEDTPGLEIGPFAIGNPSVPVSSNGQIVKIAEFLLQNPRCQAVLTGFSTPDGATSVNLQLAKSRAENTAASLRSFGATAISVAGPQILSMAENGTPSVKVNFVAKQR